MQAVSGFLIDEPRLIDALHLTDIAPDRLRTILRRAAKAADDMANVQSVDQGGLLHRLLHRVTVNTGSLHIEIKQTDLGNLVWENSVNATAQPERLIDLTVPIALRRRGVEAKLMVRAAQIEAATPDENLIALVAQGHHWFDQLAKGKAGSIKEIAGCEETDASDVGHNMQLAFLAPDIVGAILAGRQPVELTANRLRRVGTLPLEWDHQRRLLGFPT